MTDVVASKSDEPEALTVEMHFGPNPFFTNSKLTYTVKIKEDSEEPSEIEGCVIDWIEGKNLTMKKIKKKQKHKKTNETRTIVKTVP